MPTYYADNVHQELVSIFENIVFNNQGFINTKFDIIDLKYKFSSDNAKFKFFGFAKIICGYFCVYEKNEFDASYNKLFNELINFWIYPAFMPELKLIPIQESLINIPLEKYLHDFKEAFKETLFTQLNPSNKISIVKLYKYWIKNADKYYANLLTDAIKILDNTYKSK